MDEIIKKETNKKFFYKKVIQLGLPITLSQLLTSLLAFIDTMMVSVLGNNAVAAVGIGSTFFFLMIMINFGLVSGLSIFFAQYWGNKDIKNIHKVFIVSMISSLLITLVFFIFGHFFADLVVGIYNNTEDVAANAMIQEYAVNYMKIASFSYFTISLTFLISMLMRSVEKVVLPQVISVVMVALNTFLNYVLISGHLGFPELGIKGAAIATVISSAIGAIIFIIYMLNTKIEVFKIRFGVIKEIHRDFVGKLIKKALPVTVNEAFWGLGMSAYIVAFSRVSPEALTSYHVSNQIMSMVWVFNAGVSSACAIMLGNKLGEGKIEVAKNWGKRFVRLTFVFGLILGFILFLVSPFLPLIFKELITETPQVKEMMHIILTVFSFYIPIKFLNALHIVGTLRSGGDTLFTMKAEIGALWLVGVPLAFILSIYTDLPLWAIVAIVNVEEIIKLFIVQSRFFTYKWAKNLTTT